MPPTCWGEANATALTTQATQAGPAWTNGGGPSVCIASCCCPCAAPAAANKGPTFPLPQHTWPRQVGLHPGSSRHPWCVSHATAHVPVCKRPAGSPTHGTASQAAHWQISTVGCLRTACRPHCPSKAVHHNRSRCACCVCVWCRETMLLPGLAALSLPTSSSPSNQPSAQGEMTARSFIQSGVLKDRVLFAAACCSVGPPPPPPPPTPKRNCLQQQRQASRWAQLMNGFCLSVKLACCLID